MLNSTIGQRIARQRKQLGLSQEALGMRLQVSRQAISKWESDAALPEIDKLISLSKLFGVSVGWLLGVEEHSQEKEDALSEPQMKLVEELVRKYQQPPVPRLTLFHYLFAIAASLLIFLFIYGQTTRIERMLENTVGIAEFNALSARLAIAEEQLGLGAQSSNALVADYTFTVFTEEALAQRNQAELRFQALPVRWEDGDTAYLAIRREDREISRIPCRWDGKHLNALQEVELADGYEYALFLHQSDGIRQQQMLYDPVAQDLLSYLSIRLETTPGQFSYKNGVLTLTGYRVRAQQPACFFGSQPWTMMDFVLYRGGEEIGRDTVLDALQDSGTNSVNSLEIFIFGHLVQFRDLELQPGDTLDLVLEVQLASGESARCPVQSFHLTQDGDLKSQDMHP